MRRVLDVTLAVLCCLCFLVATDRRAFGYVDPGSGLLALQSFAAGLAAAAYYMRRRVWALFGRAKRPGKRADAAAAMAVPARDGGERNAV